MVTYPPDPLPLQGKGEILLREASPLFHSLTFGVFKRGASPKYTIGSLRGTKSLFRKNLPLPLAKGKGIKGMGLINNPK